MALWRDLSLQLHKIYDTVRTNARNGHKSKRINSGYCNFSVEVPQDRKSIFAPQLIPKRQKDISGIDRKIISMYGRGLSTRQISDTIEEL